MSIESEVRKRIERLVELSKAEEFPAIWAPPATDDQIRAAEQRLGFPLPPSYKAFLKIHNGAHDYFSYDRLFGTDDFASEWYEEQKEELLGVDYPPEIFEQSTPFLMAESDSGITDFTALAHRKADGNGEFEIIDWDNGAELDRVANFVAFLDAQIELHASDA